MSDTPRTKLSDIAFERYEALYEQELYREKDKPMWASEHEKAARRRVYEAVIAECSRPARDEPCIKPDCLDDKGRCDISHCPENPGVVEICDMLERGVNQYCSLAYSDCMFGCAHPDNCPAGDPK